MTNGDERIPADVIARRDSVRLGVRDALAQGVDLTSRKTASRLAAAGGLGFATAIAAIVSRDTNSCALKGHLLLRTSGLV